VVWRLVYVVVGLVGLVAIVVWAIEPADTSSQFLLFVARINVGLVVPMVLVRRRGWRLYVLDPDASSARRVQHVWQFSIGDLLVLTAGSAIFFGLMMARESHPVGEILAECLMIVCPTGILLVGLSWRRFWQAAMAALVGTAALVVGAVCLMNPETIERPRELIIMLIVLGPAVVALLVAIGTIRWFGYRLQPFEANPVVLSLCGDAESAGKPD
jgi:hypothetical protein